MTIRSDFMLSDQRPMRGDTVHRQPDHQVFIGRLTFGDEQSQRSQSVW